MSPNYPPGRDERKTLLGHDFSCTLQQTPDTHPTMCGDPISISQLRIAMKLINMPVAALEGNWTLSFNCNAQTQRHK